MLATKRAEENLIQRAMRGDLEAFNELVLCYQDAVYRYASTLTGDPDEADDITQESFIKAFQNIGSFRGGSLRAWLLKIATNVARDQWRRFKKHPTHSLFAQAEDGEEIESPAWLRDPAPSVETVAEQHEASAQLFRMLENLPAVYRSAITLVDLYELEYVEAAEILRIPIGTLKSRIARARMQMIESIQCANSREADSMDERWDILHGMNSLPKDIHSVACNAG